MRGVCLPIISGLEVQVFEGLGLVHALLERFLGLDGLGLCYLLLTLGVLVILAVKRLPVAP